MRIILILFIAISSVLQAQDDYYVPQDTTATHPQSKKELPSHASPKHCYCPYQHSTTVWDDIWNDGILGTGKAVYQSTIKPQVLGEAVGAVQGAASDSPLPTIVGETAVALGISEVHKARRHHRNKQVPEAGRACDCDPCPYHGQRYHSATGTN